MRHSRQGSATPCLCGLALKRRGLHTSVVGGLARSGSGSAMTPSGAGDDATYMSHLEGCGVDYTDPIEEVGFCGQTTGSPIPTSAPLALRAASFFAC